MYEDLKGKIALITGAGKKTGIGFAIAEKMASNGANIVIADLGGKAEENTTVKMGGSDEMREIVNELQSKYGVEAMDVELDVASNESVDEMIQKIGERFGRIDALFNNAGAAVGSPATVHDYDHDGWVKTIDINLHGVFRVSKAAVPLMKGAPAAIVNMASKAGKAPPLFNGAYGVSKAGVIMLTRVMALELASENIRVNAVCPGLIMTDLQAHRLEMEAAVFGTTVEEATQRLSSTVPMGRLGTAAEVADLSVYLVSAESSYITGQALNIGGGLLMEA